jgi:hypothetical protein
MVRYLRIAILPLIAAAVTAIPHGMAEDTGVLPPVSANRTATRLIRVIDEECRRGCDTDFASCVARGLEYVAQGVSREAGEEFNRRCILAHKACYRAC